MAYESTASMSDEAAVLRTRSAPKVRIDQDFRRAERFVVVLGAGAFGAMAGVVVAFAMGRVGIWPLAIAAPFYAFTLYLTFANLHDAAERRAFGCAVVAGLLGASLIVWPVVAMLYPMSAAPFWAAPAAVIGGLLLSASCWSGAKMAIYRFCGQAMMVMAGVAFLGVAHAMS